MPYRPKYSRRRFAKRSFKRRSSRRQPGGRSSHGGWPHRPIRACKGEVVYREFMSFTTSAIATTVGAGPGFVPAGAGYIFAANMGGFGLAATSMLAAYDEYAFVNLRMTLIPQSDTFAPAVVSGPGFISGPIGTTFLCVDTDSTATGSTPVNSAAIIRHDNCKEAPHNRKLSTGWFQPKPALLAYDPTMVAVGYAMPPHGLCWIDGSSPTVDHCGVQVWVDPPLQTNFVVRYNVRFDAVVAFRNGT